MKKKIYVKPSKPALVVGLIAVLLMLGFGIFFMNLLSSEGSDIGVGFMAFWIIIVLLIAGSYIYGLVSKNNKVGIGEEITMEDDADIADASSDFEARLRKLESLWKDKLITETEYRKKRAAILQEQW